eukprot:625392-Prorocentrum_minimum.AAC.2
MSLLTVLPPVQAAEDAREQCSRAFLVRHVASFLSANHTWCALVDAAADLDGLQSFAWVTRNDPRAGSAESSTLWCRPRL